ADGDTDGARARGDLSGGGASQHTGVSLQRDAHQETFDRTRPGLERTDAARRAIRVETGRGAFATGCGRRACRGAGALLPSTRMVATGSPPRLRTGSHVRSRPSGRNATRFSPKDVSLSCLRK